MDWLKCRLKKEALSAGTQQLSRDSRPNLRLKTSCDGVQETQEGGRS